MTTFNAPDELVFTSRQVMDGTLPILLVTHDGPGGAWQFVHGSETDDPGGNGIRVHAEHVVDLDPSVLPLADLPRGWMAWRRSREDAWIREPERRTPYDRYREARDTVWLLAYRARRLARRLRATRTSS